MSCRLARFVPCAPLVPARLRAGARAVVSALVTLALAGQAWAAGAAAAPPVSVLAADALAATAGAPARDARLAAWAKHATLDELLWVLRREPAELGHAELVLVEAALARVSPARLELRRRLEARRALLDPVAARRAGRDAAELEATRPRASVFRVGVLLPDRGDYAGYAAGVRGGLRAGLAWDRAPGALAIEADDHGTGECDVPLAVAALDTVTARCACVVGELLSVPTTALAAATRALGVPLVSPTATDEGIGRIGPAVFQVGPAGALRGRQLARAVLTGRGHKVAIVAASGLLRGPFADGFAAAAESLGATVVRRDGYAPGSMDFRATARALKLAGAEVVFWDGESREADALLRALAADGATLRLCGGSGLAPEQFHAAARMLLEGVTWVGDDWQLPAAQQAALDSLARAQGERAGPTWVRGFLAGRRIAAAVAAGARTPAELAARLRPADASMRAAGFLDCAQDGATLPVFVNVRGKPVESPRR